MPLFSKIEDFYIDFSEFNRCIAVDYGTHKIGIAVGDFENKIAFPNKVLFGDWRQLTNSINAIFNEIVAQDVNVVVIGLPKKLDGTEDKKCSLIRQISDALLKKNNNLKIFLVDERFSTKATQSWMNFECRRVKRKFNKKVCCKKDKKPDDAHAASIILDTFFKIITNYGNEKIIKTK